MKNRLADAFLNIKSNIEYIKSCFSNSFFCQEIKTDK